MIEAAALQENILAARWRSRQMQEPMADGTYRVTECDECGNEIGDERLRIAPMNLWCVECAQAHETRQRRRV
jgi:RNA polymerase-binding transcription factor DksA